MLEFRKIRIEDKDKVCRLMALMDKPVSVHWFGNIFLWQDYFNTSICIKDGFLFLRSKVFDGKKWGYLCPIGQGNREHAMQLLKEQAKIDGQALVIFSMYGDWKESEDFVYLNNRSAQDYIYDAESLRNLTGKKLQAKRNHVNNFLRKYPNIQVREMHKDDKEAFCELTRKWAEGKEYPAGELMLLKRLFDNYDDLQDMMHGIAAYDNGRIVAFSFGGKINPDTFDVMMEKADPEYENAYAFINQAFARSLPDEIKFLDREEDLGLPGLRKAKLSYHPSELRGYPTGVEKNSCIGQMFLLLKECFGDEDDFVTKYLFYFSKPETRVLIHEPDNECGLSAMFNIHLFSGNVFNKTAYLYALGVKPEQRGKGLAVEVIKQSLQIAQKRECTIALTIQANKTFNAWQNVFDFEQYSPNPINLDAPYDFDFGTGDKSQDIALCRILCMKDYLCKYAELHPDIESSLNVKDNLFKDNNGKYEISKGKVRKLNMDFSEDTISPAQVLRKCRVEDLELKFIADFND